MSFVEGVNVTARTGWTVLEIGPGVRFIRPAGPERRWESRHPACDDPTCTLDGST
jgi:hypothetical protein